MKANTLLATILAYLVGTVSAQASNMRTPDPLDLSATPTSPFHPGPQHPPKTYTPNQSLAPLVSTLQPAVVNISVEQKVRQEMMPMTDFFSPFFGSQGPQSQMPQYRVKTGQGSGFLISEDGYLLTNNHVVANADKVTVKLSDDREFEGIVVGTDSRIDIALVKIEAKSPFPYVAPGSSTEMKVGDWVVAIGNPFGLSHTVTAGIVSAKGRVIGAGPYDDFIQTDASINPGNSGGPLFNLEGEVIGINTAINAAGQGIGFAVPMDMVTPFLEDLKTTGEIARGWLGVSLQTLDEDLAAGLKLKVTSGVLLAEVHPGEPGEQAGLLSGDVISAIDGHPVSRAKDLIRHIGKSRTGTAVRLSLLRQGKSKTLNVKLGKRPAEKSLTRARIDSRSTSPGPGQSPLLKKLGLSVRGTQGGGVQITAVALNSLAAGKLRKNDRIIEVNGIRTPQVNALVNALHRRSKHIVMVISRDGRRLYIALPRP
jgi:serine protease Do